ncbi:MAG: hypothetical protein WCG27_05850 [Pseudomonadota bacterium]
MKKILKAFWEDENGQTSTEYILLVAVVSLIVFKFREVAVKKLIGIANKVFIDAENQLDSNS